jgi:hypothetical protein
LNNDSGFEKVGADAGTIKQSKATVDNIPHLKPKQHHIINSQPKLNVCLAGGNDA